MPNGVHSLDASVFYLLQNIVRYFLRNDKINRFHIHLERAVTRANVKQNVAACSDNMHRYLYDKQVNSSSSYAHGKQNFM